MEVKKILVSGGTGFIGQAIVEALRKKDYAVTILKRPEADITKPETLSSVCNGIDLVIQCAQFRGHPVENRHKHKTYFEVDALGTENLAKAAKRAGVKHFLYISGAGTGPQKAEPWFKAKWYAEQAVHSTGIPATILRPSWVYGPNDRSLNTLLKFLKFLPVFPLIGGGKNRVQPIFIGDLAAVVVACVETAGDHDRIFDVGGPEEMTMKEMLQRALAALGKKRLFLPVPKWPFKLIGFNAVDFITMDVFIDMKPLQKAFPAIRLKKLEEALKTY